MSTFLFKPWSKEEDDKLLQDLKDGETIPGIAKIHNRTANAIICRQRMLALRFISQGKSIDETVELTFLNKEKIEKAIADDKKKKEDKQAKDSETNIILKDIQAKLQIIVDHITKKE